MTNITVDRYEKTESRCVQCESMRREFDKWADQSTDEIVMNTFSAEANRDVLLDAGARSAPVYIITREGVTTVVSGDNPDIMIDALEGNDGLWSDCSL